MVDSQLGALAVGTRRELLALLLAGPQSVQRLADQLPVSRPAVSQHLKVLVDAGLANVTCEGTRRLYAADPSGVAELREWTDRLWAAAMGRFQDIANQGGPDMTTIEQKVEPVVKIVRLQLPAADAFDLFTNRMTEWWPLITHSVGEEKAVSVTVDPRLGGRITETTSDGIEHTWGTITEWEPGHRLSFTWHPGQEEVEATFVEVRVRDMDSGSELMLVHTGWEVRGDKALGLRNAYQNGWDIVLGQFTEAV